MLVQAALALGLVHHGHQLFFGDAAPPPVRKTLDSSLLPLGEQEVHRGEDHHEHRSRGRGEHGERLRGSLARLLGETSPKTRITMVSTAVDTAGPCRPQQLDEQGGGHGGGGDVDDVVADEDGGSGLL